VPEDQSRRRLRAHPDLDQIKRQAKELLAAVAARDPDALAEVNAHYRGADLAGFALHHAQLVIARSYGFDSWPKLKAYVDGATVARLVEAVRARDEPRVQAMLAARPELAHMQVSYGDEHLALHHAVFARSAPIVRLLMRHGADPHKGIHPHRDATSALTLARERGYRDIVSAIEEEEGRRRAADAVPARAAGSEPDELCDAIERGDQERAAALLKAHPALVHSSNRDGWRPLDVAAAVLDEAMVARLLHRGADPMRCGDDGRTPLDRAVTGPACRMAGAGERLAAVARLLRRHGAELTPVSAVALGEAEWLRRRHAEGSLENRIDWGSGGLLTVAVRHERPEMLALLLEFGFDPDERVRLENVDEPTYSQGFPLWQCAAEGKQAMAELLLDRGANPNVHVDSSGSAVYSAYSHRQWGMVELLRRRGGVLSADTVGLYRETDLARRMLAGEAEADAAQAVLGAGKTLAEELLHFAASGGDPEIVRMALDRVDWPREDPRWFRVLQEPLSFWHHIPWLYAGNPAFDRGTYLECFRRILVRCGPDGVGGFRRTVLHEVAAMGDHVTEEEGAAFARELLAAGAQTGVRDEILESTPLGWACRWGRRVVARALREHGANPAERDGPKWARPRAWAEKMGHAAIVALLAAHGG
jgi:ankyrin repeat protein